MHAQTIFYKSRYILSNYKRFAAGIGRQFFSSPKSLLFVFGGRAQHWVGMGSDLYYTEKVFNQYIQKCDSIIQSLGEKSILDNFEKKAGAGFFEDEANVLFTLLSFQIALYELLKSKNILPNAVMGISLGEISAIYAAGGMSLYDTLKIGAAGVALSRKEKKEYHLLHLQTSLLIAQTVLKKSPVHLPVVYEANANSILVFCHKDQLDMACHFLSSENIKWHLPYPELSYPYHTEHILNHEPLIKSFTKDIVRKPLQCDFYSSILGTVIPEGTIPEKNFWLNMVHQPVWMHGLLKQLSVSNYKTILHINTPSFSEHHLVPGPPSYKAKTTLLYTVAAGYPELKVYKTTENQLLKTKFQPSTLLNYKDNDFLGFKNKVSFYESQFYTNTLPYLIHLQNNGSVHYLPRHNEWVVLNYADAEYVLKNCEIFSSSIHKTFDEFLLGADPPSHTLVRSLLQPFFSQQRLAMIAQFTSIKANELLGELKQKSEFNVAGEFSIPLSLAVIAKFLGFTEDEGRQIHNRIKEHPYAMKFFEELKSFCRQYLENLQASNQNMPGSMLLVFVKENKISFDAAVSLLRLLWVAGMTTTSMLTSSAVLLLGRNQHLWQQLKQDDQLLNKFIEECLRLEAPESEVRRVTTCQVKLGSQIIPQGSTVVIKLLAANRDPEYFNNPDDVQLDRVSKKHLSFGGGYHYCLGAGMARMETKIALKAILEQLSVLKIDNHRLEYFPSPHLRGLSNLPVINGVI